MVEFSYGVYIYEIYQNDKKESFIGSISESYKQRGF